MMSCFWNQLSWLPGNSQTQTHPEMLTAGQRRVFVSNPGGGLGADTQPDPKVFYSGSDEMPAGSGGPVQAEPVFRALLSPLKDGFILSSQLPLHVPTDDQQTQLIIGFSFCPKHQLPVVRFTKNCWVFFLCKLTLIVNGAGWRHDVTRYPRERARASTSRPTTEGTRTPLSTRQRGRNIVICHDKILI